MIEQSFRKVKGCLISSCHQWEKRCIEKVTKPSKTINKIVGHTNEVAGTINCHKI